MRIASLVPSATEILFALGLGDRVVAVTHECDHPPAAAEPPRLTRSLIEDGLTAAEIDARVLELTGRGEALYELDEPALAALDVDLIVTQALCAVCAVSFDDVRAVAARLASAPRVLSLDPVRLGDVLDDVVRVAEAAGEPRSGEELRRALAARIEALPAVAERPRVLPLEWLDPPYLGGHWVPEMISAAGGEPLGLEPGERSRSAEWDELRAMRPDAVIVMPCGLGAGAAAAEARAHIDRLASLGAGSVHAVDAAASFSRPGPRLADGAELLSRILRGAEPQAGGLRGIAIDVASGAGAA